MGDMDGMDGSLAWLMAGMHLTLIAFLITGAWLAHGRPGLRRAHLLAIGATAAVFLAGADCPLTVWENHFRDAAGWDTYGEGFVVHYLIEPLTGVGRLGPGAQVLVVAAWVVPTILGYLVAGSGTKRYRHASGGPSSTRT